MLVNKTAILVNREGVQNMKKNAPLSFPTPLFTTSMRNISQYKDKITAALEKEIKNGSHIKVRLDMEDVFLSNMKKIRNSQAKTALFCE